MYFMYLRDCDFNLEKKNLQMENRDSLVFVCFFHPDCAACFRAKNSMEILSEKCPEVSFALCNVARNRGVVDMAAEAGLDLKTSVPVLALFKLGHFDRKLGFSSLDERGLRAELDKELGNKNRPGEPETSQKIASISLSKRPGKFIKIKDL